LTNRSASPFTCLIASWTAASAMSSRLQLKRVRLWVSLNGEGKRSRTLLHSILPSLSLSALRGTTLDGLEEAGFDLIVSNTRALLPVLDRLRFSRKEGLGIYPEHLVKKRRDSVCQFEELTV
jgi:hypothetical protein